MIQTNTNQYKEEIKQSIKPTHNQLHEALMGIQDLLERSTIEFVLLGDTAKKISSEELPNFNMDKIHIGVTRLHYHKTGKSMLKSLLFQEHISFNEDENHLFLDYKGVPIEIDIIDNYYSFFVYPDTRFYTITEFKIPNPMNEYLEKAAYVR